MVVVPGLAVGGCPLALQFYHLPKTSGDRSAYGASQTETRRHADPTYPHLRHQRHRGKPGLADVLPADRHRRGRSLAGQELFVFDDPARQRTAIADEGTAWGFPG